MLRKGSVCRAYHELMQTCQKRISVSAVNGGGYVGASVAPALPLTDKKEVQYEAGS